MPDKEEGDDKKSTKDVVNKKQKQMMGEEGYDVARDMGRVKPSKDKKDATTMPVSDEVKKTQKVNKGPSALERVKANIEKKYGKGAIMNVKKEELDLTKVAESFGGYIIEEPKDPKKKFKQGELKFDSGAKGTSPSGSPDMGGTQKKFVQRGRKFSVTSKEPVRISDKNFQDLKDMVTGKKSADDLDVTRKGEKVATKPKVTSGSVRTTDVKIGKGGQAELPLGDVSGQKNIKDIKNVSDATGRTTPVTGERLKGRKLGSKNYLVKRGTSFKQLRLKGIPATSPTTGRVDLRTVNTKKRVTTKRPYTGPTTASGRPVLKKDIKRAVQGGVKSPVGMGKKIIKTLPQQTQATRKIATQLTKGGLQKTKQLGKVAGKRLARKTIGRAGAKFAAKQIPGLGTVISGGEAIARFATGDLVGGALSAAEMIPGIGMAAGLANVGRDIGTAKGVVKAFRKSKQIRRGIAGYQRSGTAKAIRKMQRTAKKNPLATVAGAGGVTAIGANVARPRGGLPRIPKPKLDQGVVGRRTAG